MLSCERKLIDWIIRRKNVIFFLIVTVFACAARVGALDYMTRDMELCLIPWAEAFRAKDGFSAMREQIGDYNILYQTIIVLLTRLPGSLIHLYKYVSIFFDFLLALGSAWVITKETGGKAFDFTFDAVYALIIFLPTVFLNSAVWGQCDSMYGCLCLLALYTLYKEHYIPSFIALGIALALKLQAVFIVPVYIYLYICRKNFSLLNFLITLAVLWATGIPAYLQGRPLTTVFDIYMLQMSEYAGMTFNGTTFWVLFFPDYQSMHICAILVTMLVLGGFLFYFLSKGKHLKTDFESFLIVAAWSAWTCVLFLPGMHERYTYLADLLLVLLAILSAKYRPYALLSVGITGITYTNYLAQYSWTDTIQYLSPMIVALWLCFTFRRLPGCLEAALPSETASAV